MGILPLAISWPPERRTADAKGAAHRFSQMSTPSRAPRLHRRGEVVDILRGQELCQLDGDVLHARTARTGAWLPTRSLLALGKYTGFYKSAVSDLGLPWKLTDNLVRGLW
jgi:hypothetical protein